jgi:two-component system sensor histidine kinase KdpD
MASERIVIGLNGGGDGDLLVRRAAKLLERAGGGEVAAIHVRTPSRARDESPHALETQRRHVAELGGSYHALSSADVAAALLDYARTHGATHILVGQSRRRPALLSGGSVEARVVRGAGDIDVQVVPRPAVSRLEATGAGRFRTGLGRRRVIGGFALAAVLPAGLQLLLAVFDHSVATATLLQLAGAVAVALVGGLWPAVAGALWSSLLVNYFSTEPLHDLAIHDPQDILSLVVFAGVAVAVAGVVDRSARRSKEAAAARAEAATLADLALAASREEDNLKGLLAEALSVFGASGAAVLTRAPAGSGAGAGSGAPGDTETAVDGGARLGRGTWRLVAAAGDAAGLAGGPVAPGTPGTTVAGTAVAGTTVEQVDEDTSLVLLGREVPPSGRRLLAAFAVHVKAQLERRQLAATRHEMLRLAEGNTMRTAILRAVSHDLRTPLAGIKLAAGGLLQNGVSYTPAEQHELLETIDACTDRLDLLVGNLLDMSRITAQSVEPLLGPVRWSEAVDAALRGLPKGAVSVSLPANMPPVDADPGLLERVVANILENALKYAAGSGVLVAGGPAGSVLDGHPCGELQIIDHGPGVPARKVVDMFRPFQRLDDLPQSSGIGLGLAVAQGFVQSMRGTLTARETPGGGLTMVIRLPLSTGVPAGTPGGLPGTARIAGSVQR